MITIMKHYSQSLNGRDTRSFYLKDIVKEKTIRALKASNNWSSTENSTNNSDNVNFSNGNANNNNKYNGNNVRALVELSEDEKVEWIEAYLDCCKNKMSSKLCTLYRMYVEYDLMRLASEVKNRIYIPSTSTTFLVTRPKLREIFAANFRDRIVLHWIILKINPLIEERFHKLGDVSFNCRKNFGTLKAILRLLSNLEQVTCYWTKEAYVGKYDLKSFFMKIDVEVLYKLLEDFLREEYKLNDLEQLLYITKITLYHRSLSNCIKNGPDLWDQLDPDKSLLGKTEYIGLPIGNITSLILANFYLSYLDEILVNYCKQHNGEYIRFVDDFLLIMPDYHDLNYIIDYVDNWIVDTLHIRMHLNKRSILKVYNGVSFIGSVIKPNRVYLSNRTFGGLYNALTEAENYCRIIYRNPDISHLRKLQNIQCTLNSYLGFTRHNKSYLQKIDMLRDKEYLWKVFDIDADLTTFTINKTYNLRNNVYDRRAKFS